MSDPKRSGARRRFVLFAVAVVLGALAWGAKELVESMLADGHPVDIGLLELRLTYNSGVAFSLGAGLPTWVIIAVTGAITLVIAGYAWFAAPDIAPLGIAGLAAVLAGAATNLINRAVDGMVTDYLHTGWFATFNAADSMITVGAVSFAIATMFSRPADREPATQPDHG